MEVQKMAEFQAAAREVKDILAMVNGLDTAERDNIRQDVGNRLQMILTSIGLWESVNPSDDDAIRNVRNQIAHLRQSLPPAARDLELVRTEWADRYRQQLGDGKDEFEKLSEQLQQQQSPEAYRWKHNFEEVTDVMDAVNRLNGQLMDLSSQLEHENAETKPPIQDTGPPYRSDRDPEMPANMS
jgi:chromosome segregation ATPase